jgi:hypothetical protein
MAFTRDLRKSARRHLEAAQTLATGTRKDVAGYLYGIAAECAIKVMMELAPVRNNDAFYAHFPQLRTLLRDALKGRRSIPLSTFINDDSFMNNWDINMRYADGAQVRPEWVAAWGGQASRAVSAMES